MNCLTAGLLAVRYFCQGFQKRYALDRCSLVVFLMVIHTAQELEACGTLPFKQIIPLSFTLIVPCSLPASFSILRPSTLASPVSYAAESKIELLLCTAKCPWNIFLQHIIFLSHLMTSTTRHIWNCENTPTVAPSFLKGNPNVPR